MTLLIDSLRGQLQAATERSIASSEEEVRVAVRLIAALVREKYPDAKRVELEESDQGDWLVVTGIDDLDDWEADSELNDDLSSASMCIYEAHRGAAEALHPSDPGHLIERAPELYIDIEEALK